MKLILTLEQFPIFLAGAYGNKTRPTPGLDRWALRSTTFDRAYSTCADGLETLFQLWESCDFSAERFAGRKIFLSDLPVEAPEFFDAGRTVSSEAFFSDLVSIPADSPAETGLVWVHFREWDADQLDSWLLNSVAARNLFALLGTSGELPAGDVRLYSSEIQLPWWIRFPEPAFEGTHCPALVTADDFQKILDAGTPDAVFRDSVRILTDDDRWAVVTPDWFLTGFENVEEEEAEADAPELYAKPDDWWDQNDVASRCFEEVQELTKLLTLQN